MSTNTTEESYYNDKYDAIVASEFTYLETSQTKLTASIVHACCGSLSSLSSVLVLSLIYRSQIGLSSTHHRFLFAIGICDFISSFAIGLSTLPMPKDMIYTQFEGKSFGNFITSDIQGFCAHYFSGLMISYNCGLCFYYLCIIPFQMSKKKFGTRVEPFIHIGVQCFHLPIDLSLVLTKSFNPSPNASWVIPNPYPFYCSGEKSCMLRGSMNTAAMALNILAIFQSSLVLLAILSMVIIAMYVYTQNKLLQIIRQKPESNINSEEKIIATIRQATCAQRNKNVTHMFFFAVAYTLSCLMAAFPGIVLPLIFLQLSEFWISFLIAMVPSAGVLNMVIFVAEKVYHQRRVDENLTFSQALRKVIQGRSEQREVLISNIQIVHKNWYWGMWRERQRNIIFHVDDNKQNDGDSVDRYDNVDDRDISWKEDGGNKHSTMSEGKIENASSEKPLTSSKHFIDSSSFMSRLSFISSLNSVRLPVSGADSVLSAGLSYFHPKVSEHQDQQDNTAMRT